MTIETKIQLSCTTKDTIEQHDPYKTFGNLKVPQLGNREWVHKTTVSYYNVVYQRRHLHISGYERKVMNKKKISIGQTKQLYLFVPRRRMISC